MNRRDFLQKVAAINAGIVLVPPTFIASSGDLQEIVPGYLFNPNGLDEFRPNVINMVDLGLLEDKPAYRTRYEYYCTRTKELFARNSDTYKIDTVGKTPSEVNTKRAEDGVLAVRMLVQDIERYDRVSTSVEKYALN